MNLTAYGKSHEDFDLSEQSGLQQKVTVGPGAFKKLVLLCLCHNTFCAELQLSAPGAGDAAAVGSWKGSTGLLCHGCHLSVWMEEEVRLFAAVLCC